METAVIGKIFGRPFDAVTYVSVLTGLAIATVGTVPSVQSTVGSFIAEILNQFAIVLATKAINKNQMICLYVNNLVSFIAQSAKIPFSQVKYSPR